MEEWFEIHDKDGNVPLAPADVYAVVHCTDASKDQIMFLDEFLEPARSFLQRELWSDPESVLDKLFSDGLGVDVQQGAAPHLSDKMRSQIIQRGEKAREELSRMYDEWKEESLS